MEKNYILSPEVAAKKLKRMAFEILENNFGETGFILAGIRESGTAIAETIQELLKEIAGIHTELITVSLDKKNPKEVTISRSLDFQNRVIILTAWQAEDAARRTRKAADSSSSRNSRGRSGPPDARAAGRPSHRGRE